MNYIALALVLSLLALVLLIPGRVWYGLFYVGMVIAAGYIAYWSLIFLLIRMANG